jgi:hypothetical protein
MSEINYSIALRCIGQDLERRGLKAFAIKRDGNHFVVLPNDPNGSAAVSTVIRYTPSDIEIIDRSGETRRGDRWTQEFLHRAQMLRSIGDYLDKYGSALISITYNAVDQADSPFRVEYITREGEHHIDDRPGTEIFDECVLMFQKRSKTAEVPRRTSRSDHE